MIEEIIAFILLIAYLCNPNIETLKTCGIFCIASYLGLINRKLNKKNDE